MPVPLAGADGQTGGDGRGHSARHARPVQEKHADGSPDAENRGREEFQTRVVDAGFGVDPDARTDAVPDGHRVERAELEVARILGRRGTGLRTVVRSGLRRSHLPGLRSGGKSALRRLGGSRAGGRDRERRGKNEGRALGNEEHSLIYVLGLADGQVSGSGTRVAGL
jgi:hypothetical protein